MIRRTASHRTSWKALGLAGRIVFGALLVGVVATPASRADARSLAGLWLTADDPDGRSHVEILDEGGTFGGRIVWLEKPTYPDDDPGGMAGQSRIDRNNPDAGLTRRPILGLEILGGFESDGDGRWEGGWIYDPTNGKTYKCKLRLEGETLHVRGFIGFSLIGRTTEWTRVSSP